MKNYNYIVETWERKINDANIFTPNVASKEADYESAYADTLYTISLYDLPEAIKYEALVAEQKEEVAKLEAQLPIVREAFINAGNVYDTIYDKWYDQIGTYYDWSSLHCAMSSSKAAKTYNLYESIRDMHNISKRDGLNIRFGSYSGIEVEVNWSENIDEQIYEACKSMVESMKKYESLKRDIKWAKETLDEWENKMGNRQYSIIEKFWKLQDKLDNIDLGYFTIANLDIKQNWLNKVKSSILDKIATFKMEAEELELLNYTADSMAALSKFNKLERKLWEDEDAIETYINYDLDNIRHKIQYAKTIEEVEEAALNFINRDKIKKAEKSAEFEKKVVALAEAYYGQILPTEMKEKINYYSESKIAEILGETRKATMKQLKGTSSNQIRLAVAEAEAEKKAEIERTIEKYKNRIYFSEIAIAAVKAFREYDSTVEVITDDYERAMREFKLKYGHRF